jgi:hypothetical protein
MVATSEMEPQTRRTCQRIVIKARAGEHRWGGARGGEHR